MHIPWQSQIMVMFWAWGLQSGGRLALKTPFDGKSCPIPSESSSVLEIGGKAANRTVKQWTIVNPVNLSRWSRWRRKKKLVNFVTSVTLQSSLSKTKYAKSTSVFQDRTFTYFCRSVLCPFLQGPGSSMATHRKTNATQPTHRDPLISWTDLNWFNDSYDSYLLHTCQKSWRSRPKFKRPHVAEALRHNQTT